jgi:hypothetical protein
MIQSGRKGLNKGNDTMIYCMNMSTPLSKVYHQNINRTNSFSMLNVSFIMILELIITLTLCIYNIYSLYLVLLLKLLLETADVSSGLLLHSVLRGLVAEAHLQ